MAEEKGKPTNEEQPKDEESPAAEEKSTFKESPNAEEKPKKQVKKKVRRNVPEGCAYIQATYNNTIVTITDTEGAVIAWSSAGANGFKGARKSTPYAASVASQKAVEKAKLYGLDKVHVVIKGIGNGREQAVRTLQANGLNVLTIKDTTPIPHNGCRRPKRRRV